MNKTRLYLMCIISALFPASLLHADSPDDVVRIEEHWEVSIGTPCVASNAPQVTNAFAPLQQGNVLYATFNINNRLVNGEEFAAGGLQLQLWHGERLLGTKSSDRNDKLQIVGEQISWKQVITIGDDGLVRFSVADGDSETFGSFGPNMSLAVLTNLHSLNDYRPADSLDHSGTVYASHRVDHLRLEKVVVTKRDGTTKEIVIPDAVCEAGDHCASNHHHYDH